jgi:hypothetical protein
MKETKGRVLRTKYYVVHSPLVYYRFAETGKLGDSVNRNWKADAASSMVLWPLFSGSLSLKGARRQPASKVPQLSVSWSAVDLAGPIRHAKRGETFSLVISMSEATCSLIPESDQGKMLFDDVRFSLLPLLSF